MSAKVPSEEPTRAPAPASTAGSAQRLEGLVGPLDVPALDAERDELTDRYEVGDRIGRGGMGEVRMARDRRLRRAVAVKLARARGVAAGSVQRFLREARITSQLEHPNIPPVYDFGASGDGRLYYAMKNVRGVTLAALARDATVPLSRRIEIFLKVCDAVAFAHSRGVVHRDLKPQNVMVGTFGRVYVLDWGIARLMAEPDGGEGEIDADAPGQDATGAGAVIGTLSCMSPEQATGAALDERSDVYALGILLYRLLADCSPYEAKGRTALLEAVVAADVRPLRSAAPGVPWELAAIVHACLARLPGDRYPDVPSLREDIERFVDQRPVSAARYSLAARAGKWMWRHRQVVAAAGVTGAIATALLVGTLVVYVVSVLQARDRAQQAERAGQVALADSLVSLAQARAEDGDTVKALTLLADAEGHYAAADHRPWRAIALRSWLYRDAAPPLMSWEHASERFLASVAPDGRRVHIADGPVRAAFDAVTGERLLTVRPALEPLWSGWLPTLQMIHADDQLLRGTDMATGRPCGPWTPSRP